MDEEDRQAIISPGGVILAFIITRNDPPAAPRKTPAGEQPGLTLDEERADWALRYAARLRLGPGAVGCCRCTALPSGTVPARVAARKSKIGCSSISAPIALIGHPTPN